VDFRGEKRSNQTRESMTDPEARAGEEARRRRGHQLVHSRHVLKVRHFRGRHRLIPETLAADTGYEAGASLQMVEEEFTAEDACRRILRRMKTLGYRASQQTVTPYLVVCDAARTLGSTLMLLRMRSTTDVPG